MTIQTFLMQKPIAFAGVDTETQDGLAVLVATPRQYLLFPKSFRQIVDFLLINGPNCVAYNMDYDARAILKFLPQAILTELGLFNIVLLTDGTRIKYIPSKYLEIRRAKRVITLYDAFQFFRTSLDKAALAVFNEGKDEISYTWIVNMRYYLSRGKSREKIIKYCLRDAELVERLFARLQQQFDALHIDFSRPVSTGALAKRAFNDHFAKRNPAWLNDHIQPIFYGGRIEIYKRGSFRDARIYDINSAYPYALSQFINPADCAQTVTLDRRLIRQAAYGFMDITCYIPPNVHIPPLPVVGNLPGMVNPVSFPSGIIRTRTDLYTYRLLNERHWIDKVHFARVWLPTTNEKWFPEIPALYMERAKQPELSLAIKLVLNSLYGKFAERRTLNKVLDSTPDAQSIFHQGKFYTSMRIPVGHTDFLVAAHITGYVRAMLYRFMEHIGFDKIIQCHTDSVHVTNTAHHAVTGNALGEWKLETTAKRLLVIGTGVYAYETEQGWTNRFRGFHTRSNIAELLDRKRTTIKVPVTEILTLREAIAQRRLSSLNVIEEILRDLDVNFDTKRQWGQSFKHASSVLHTQQDSEPWLTARLY